MSAWALAHGHEIVDVVADTKSGTSAPWSRPNMRPWVTRPELIVQYDAILAYAMDRLTRGDDESTNEIEDWARANGKVLITVDGLKFPCEGIDGIYWDVSKRLAHQYWLETSGRYTRMQSFLKSEGKLVGRPPFGYEVVPAEGGHKTLVPTELGRKYVPLIFAKVLAKTSLDDIALALTAEAVPTAGGGEWSHQAVGQIVKCSTMMGRRKDASGKTILKCEALVDPATFRLANEAPAARTHRGPAKNENKALMTGVMRCFRCSGPMYRIMTGHGASKRPYYRCAGKGAVLRSGCKNMIDAAAADAIVNEKMAKNTRPVMTTKIKPGHNHEAELEDVRQQMADLPLGTLSDAEVDIELKLLRAKRDELLDAEDVPDELVEEPTGMTVSQMWASLKTDSARNQWMVDAKVRIFGYHAAKGGDTDAEVLALAQEPTSMFWSEDGFEPPLPSVNGNWIYVSPLTGFRMRQAALARPRT